MQRNFRNTTFDRSVSLVKTDVPKIWLEIYGLSAQNFDETRRSDAFVKGCGVEWSEKWTPIPGHSLWWISALTVTQQGAEIL